MFGRGKLTYLIEVDTSPFAPHYQTTWAKLISQ